MQRNGQMSSTQILRVQRSAQSFEPKIHQGGGNIAVGHDGNHFYYGNVQTRAYIDSDANAYLLCLLTCFWLIEGGIVVLQLSQQGNKYLCPAKHDSLVLNVVSNCSCRSVTI